MKRKIISAFLALLLCLSMAITVSADSEIQFIVDELGYLEAEELALLNETAMQLYDFYGVGIFFVFTSSASLEDYDIASLVGELEHYVVMMENETNWFTFYGGVAENIDPETENELRAIYDETKTYTDGVAAFLFATSECFMDADIPVTEAPAETVPVETAAVETVPVEQIPAVSEPVLISPAPSLPAAEGGLILDGADLLTDSEELSLTQQLTQVSDAYNAQIIIATVASAEGKTTTSLINNLYDSMELGFGPESNGVMLLVCMDPREYRILGNGYAGYAIDSSVIDTIGEAIVSDLTDGDYADAFEIFAEKCDYYLNGYLNGFPFKTVKNLLIALAIGIVLALIVTSALKAQLKSVHKQEQANVYVRGGSMQLTLSNDIFLYRNVTRTKKQSSNSSGSRSGGSSRSVGGGSF